MPMLVRLRRGQWLKVCAAEEGDLRLVGQVDINGFSTGALQVFRNGAYGAVCIEGFDAVDAGVACRQLGFIGGTAIPLAIRRRFGRLEQRLLIEVWPACYRLLGEESLAQAEPHNNCCSKVSTSVIRSTYIPGMASSVHVRCSLASFFGKLRT